MNSRKYTDNVPVLVVGSANANAVSMDRYSLLLYKSYTARGVNARLVSPPNVLSKNVAEGSLKKYIKYVEALIIFPLYLAALSFRKVVHFADHSDAILIPWTLFSSRRIVTCHDLIAVRAALGEIPEYQPKALGKIYQKMVVRGLRQSDSIAAVSRATAVDVNRLIPNTQVHILLNPLDVELTHQASSMQKSEPYFLIVAHSSWRKGRDESIKMWVKLQSQIQYAKAKLIIVGPQLSEGEKEGLSSKQLSQIQIQTQINDEKLSGLYSGCTALIQMSKYEGFGWPVIEVNAQGRPAICSDIEVFHEIGEHNIFISPSKSLDQVCEEINTFAGDQVSRYVLDKFSLDKFQTRLISILHSNTK